MPRHRMVTGLVWFLMALLVSACWADIATQQERIRNSGLNPELCNWRGEHICVLPPAQRKETAPETCFRYDFQLPTAPRQAAVTLQTHRRHCTVFVNGKVLLGPGAALNGARHLDLTSHLHAGHNVIAVRAEVAAKDSEHILQPESIPLLGEGIVFCQDGSTVRLLTDTSWRGGLDLPEGWYQPETDPTAFKHVTSRGVAKWDPWFVFYNPPYYGPIQVAPVGEKNPIFDEEKPVQFKVALLNVPQRGKPSPALTYTVFDERRRKTVGQGAIDLSPAGKFDLAGSMRHRPLPAGAYSFRFVLTSLGQEVGRRDYEIVSVGKIKQRLVEGTHYEEGLELKKVWSVDCTADPEPGQFLACDSGGKEVETEVVEGPAGRYRALVKNRGFTSFAYRFKVQQLFVPHLVVVEWPDDADRAILAQVHEGTTMIPSAWVKANAGYQRCEASVICTDEHPVRTNRLQKLHLLYWPNEEEAAIHIWNASGGKAPAAAARITVYQIMNDLPALRIADAGERMIGYHTERGPFTMVTTYYAGPLGAFFGFKVPGWSMGNDPEFYRDWYTTTENMIKRMRFSGQNMYLMGHFMYRGVLYPSKTFPPNYGTHYSEGWRDYIALILRMFGRNKLNLVSGIEYVHNPDLIAQFTATLEEVIQKGAPTIYSINKDASVSALHGYAHWGGLNYFHPRVQEDILRMVDELVELYKGCPAWRGIAFILSRNFGPMSAVEAQGDPLDYGYEDYTIELFQKETGIKIPVDAKDPERFQKRYGWLMANAKQKWIDWRCRQYTGLFRKIRDRVLRGRPDLKLYLMNYEPMSFTNQIESVAGHLDDPAAMRDAVKRFGFDPEVLKKERGIVISYSYLTPGSPFTQMRRPGTFSHQARSRVWRELVHSQSWNDLFANDGKGGAYIWTGIPHYGYKAIPKGKWLFEYSSIRQGYFWPRFVNDAFVNALVRSNPTWMPHTWMDMVESGGRLHEMRLFARAYRSLPNGKYQRLSGNGLDKNIWVERTWAESAEYAYAANPHWWEAEVTLNFASGAKVHDLIKDRPVTLKSGTWSFRLGPYEVQTFQIKGAGSVRSSAIQAAQVRVAEQAAKKAQSIIDQAMQEARKTVAAARAKETALKDSPEWKTVSELEDIISEIERLNRAGDLARAYEIARSWRLASAQMVIGEALKKSE